MWKTVEFEVRSGLNKYQIFEGDQVLSFQKWIDYLKESESFVKFYNNILVKSKFEAFFWEVKPIDKKRLQEPFEFVLVNSDSLTKIASDNSFFKKYFEADKAVVAFANLSGDAQLVVPTQIVDVSNYNHIATFVRNCPDHQILQFWKKVGAEYEQQIGTKTKWLSTSGLGVYWLHVRIDSRPKYYQYAQYKNA